MAVYKNPETGDIEDDEDPSGWIVTNAIGRGIDQSQAMLYATANALASATGIDFIARWGEEGMERNVRQMLENPARVERWDDVEGLATFGNYVLERILEQIPSLGATILAMGATRAPGAVLGARAAVASSSSAAAGAGMTGAAKQRALAAFGKRISRKVGTQATQEMRKKMGAEMGATAGGVLGGFAYTSGENIGESRMNQLMEGSEAADAPAAAIFTGMTKGAVDLIGVHVLTKAARLTGLPAAEIVRRGESRVRRIAGAGVTEGLTEGLQTYIDQAMMSKLTGEDLHSDKNWDEIKEAMIAGATVGVGLTGISSLLSRGRSRITDEAERTPAEREILQDRIGESVADIVQRSTNPEITPADPSEPSQAAAAAAAAAAGVSGVDDPASLQQAADRQAADRRRLETVREQRRAEDDAAAQEAEAAAQKAEDDAKALEEEKQKRRDARFAAERQATDASQAAAQQRVDNANRVREQQRVRNPALQSSPELEQEQNDMAGQFDTEVDSLLHTIGQSQGREALAQAEAVVSDKFPTITRQEDDDYTPMTREGLDRARVYAEDVIVDLRRRLGEQVAVAPSPARQYLEGMERESIDAPVDGGHAHFKNSGVPLNQKQLMNVTERMGLPRPEGWAEPTLATTDEVMLARSANATQAKRSAPEKKAAAVAQKAAVATTEEAKEPTKIVHPQSPDALRQAAADREEKEADHRAGYLAAMRKAGIKSPAEKGGPASYRDRGHQITRTQWQAALDRGNAQLPKGWVEPAFAKEKPKKEKPKKEPKPKSKSQQRKIREFEDFWEKGDYNVTLPRERGDWAVFSDSGHPLLKHHYDSAMQQNPHIELPDDWDPPYKGGQTRKKKRPEGHTDEVEKPPKPPRDRKREYPQGLSFQEALTERKIHIPDDRDETPLWINDDGQMGNPIETGSFDRFLSDFGVTVPEGTPAITFVDGGVRGGEQKQKAVPVNYGKPGSPKTGVRQNAVLDNRYPSTFTHEGHEYQSAEHAYQTLKSGVVDEDVRTNSKWKEPGARVTVPDVAGREEENATLLARVNKSRAEQDPAFREALEATGDRPIAYGKEDDVTSQVMSQVLTDLRSDPPVTAQPVAETPAPAVETPPPPVEIPTPAPNPTVTRSNEDANALIDVEKARAALQTILDTYNGEMDQYGVLDARLKKEALEELSTVKLGRVLTELKAGLGEGHPWIPLANSLEARVDSDLPVVAIPLDNSSLSKPRFQQYVQGTAVSSVQDGKKVHLGLTLNSRVLREAIASDDPSDIAHIYRVALHETVHIAVGRAMADAKNVELTQQMDQLRRAFRDDVRFSGNKEKYADLQLNPHSYSSSEEFVVALLTDFNVQRAAKQIPVPDGWKAGKPATSLWHKAVNAVVEFFKLKADVSHNVLDEMMSLTAQVVGEASPRAPVTPDAPPIQTFGNTAFDPNGSKVAVASANRFGGERAGPHGIDTEAARGTLKRALEELSLPVSEYISGNEGGADILTAEWSHTLQPPIPVRDDEVRATDAVGDANPTDVRNARVAKDADIIIAFLGRESKNSPTNNLIWHGKQLEGKRVIVFDYEGNKVSDTADGAPAAAITVTPEEITTERERQEEVEAAATVAAEEMAAARTIGSYVTSETADQVQAQWDMLLDPNNPTDVIFLPSDGPQITDRMRASLATQVDRLNKNREEIRARASIAQRNNEPTTEFQQMLWQVETLLDAFTIESQTISITDDLGGTGVFITNDSQRMAELQKVLDVNGVNPVNTQQLGALLYDRPEGKFTGGDDMVVAILGADGDVITTVVTSEDTMDADVAKAEAAMPPGGHVYVAAAEDAIAWREVGARVSDYERGIYDAKTVDKAGIFDLASEEAIVAREEREQQAEDARDLRIAQNAEELDDGGYNEGDMAGDDQLRSALQDPATEMPILYLVNSYHNRPLAKSERREATAEEKKVGRGYGTRAAANQKLHELERDFPRDDVRREVIEYRFTDIRESDQDRINVGDPTVGPDPRRTYFLIREILLPPPMLGETLVSTDRAHYVGAKEIPEFSSRTGDSATGLNYGVPADAVVQAGFRKARDEGKQIHGNMTKLQDKFAKEIIDAFTKAVSDTDSQQATINSVLRGISGAAETIVNATESGLTPAEKTVIQNSITATVEKWAEESDVSTLKALISDAAQTESGILMTALAHLYMPAGRVQYFESQIRRHNAAIVSVSMFKDLGHMSGRKNENEYLESQQDFEPRQQTAEFLYDDPHPSSAFGVHRKKRKKGANEPRVYQVAVKGIVDIGRTYLYNIDKPPTDERTPFQSNLAGLQTGLRNLHMLGVDLNQPNGPYVGRGDNKTLRPDLLVRAGTLADSNSTARDIALHQLLGNPTGATLPHMMEEYYPALAVYIQEMGEYDTGARGTMPTAPEAPNAPTLPDEQTIGERNGMWQEMAQLEQEITAHYDAANLLSFLIQPGVDGTNKVLPFADGRSIKQLGSEPLTRVAEFGEAEFLTRRGEILDRVHKEGYKYEDGKRVIDPEKAGLEQRKKHLMRELEKKYPDDYYHFWNLRERSAGSIDYESKEGGGDAHLSAYIDELNENIETAFDAVEKKKKELRNYGELQNLGSEQVPNWQLIVTPAYDNKGNYLDEKRKFGSRGRIQKRLQKAQAKVASIEKAEAGKVSPEAAASIQALESQIEEAKAQRSEARAKSRRSVGEAGKAVKGAEADVREIEAEVLQLESLVKVVPRDPTPEKVDARVVRLTKELEKLRDATLPRLLRGQADARQSLEGTLPQVARMSVANRLEVINESVAQTKIKKADIQDKLRAVTQWQQESQGRTPKEIRAQLHTARKNRLPEALAKKTKAEKAQNTAMEAAAAVEDTQLFNLDHRISDLQTQLLDAPHSPAMQAAREDLEAAREELTRFTDIMKRMLHIDETHAGGSPSRVDLNTTAQMLERVLQSRREGIGGDPKQGFKRIGSTINLLNKHKANMLRLERLEIAAIRAKGMEVGNLSMSDDTAVDSDNSQYWAAWLKDRREERKGGHGQMDLMGQRVDALLAPINPKDKDTLEARWKGRTQIHPLSENRLPSVLAQAANSMLRQMRVTKPMLLIDPDGVGELLTQAKKASESKVKIKDEYEFQGGLFTKVEIDAQVAALQAAKTKLDAGGFVTTFVELDDANHRAYTLIVIPDKAEQTNIEEVGKSPEQEQAEADAEARLKMIVNKTPTLDVQRSYSALSEEEFIEGMTALGFDMTAEATSPVVNKLASGKKENSPFRRPNPGEKVIYVGRTAGGKNAGQWGNPFTTWGKGALSVEEVVARYRQYILDRATVTPDGMRGELASINGKAIGYSNPPAGTHAEVLATAAAAAAAPSTIEQTDVNKARADFQFRQYVTAVAQATAAGFENRVRSSDHYNEVAKSFTKDKDKFKVPAWDDPDTGFRAWLVDRMTYQIGFIAAKEGKLVPSRMTEAMHVNEELNADVEVVLNAWRWLTGPRSKIGPAYSVPVKASAFVPTEATPIQYMSIIDFHEALRENGTVPPVVTIEPTEAIEGATEGGGRTQATNSRATNVEEDARIQSIDAARRFAPEPSAADQAARERIKSMSVPEILASVNESWFPGDLREKVRAGLRAQGRAIDPEGKVYELGAPRPDTEGAFERGPRAQKRAEGREPARRAAQERARERAREERRKRAQEIAEGAEVQAARKAEYEAKQRPKSKPDLVEYDDTSPFDDQTMSETGPEAMERLRRESDVDEARSQRDFKPKDRRAHHLLLQHRIKQSVAERLPFLRLVPWDVDPTRNAIPEPRTVDPKHEQFRIQVQVVATPQGLRHHEDLPPGTKIRDNVAGVLIRNPVRKGEKDGVTFDRGPMVVLVSDNVEDVDHAARIIRHEVLGHYGVAEFMNNDERKAFRARVKASNTRFGVKDLFDEVTETYSDLTEEGQIDEVISRIAEYMVNPTDAQKKHVGMWIRLKNVMLRFLRKLGFVDKNARSEEELRGTLRVVANRLAHRGMTNNPAQDVIDTPMNWESTETLAQTMVRIGAKGKDAGAYVRNYNLAFFPDLKQWYRASMSNTRMAATPEGEVNKFHTKLQNAFNAAPDVKPFKAFMARGAQLNAIAPRIAKKAMHRAQTRRGSEDSYETGVVLRRTYWMGVYTEIVEKYKLQENPLIAERVYMELASEVPYADKSEPAKVITNFLKDFGEYAKTIDGLELEDNYFPREHNQMAYRNNPEKAINLFVKHRINDPAALYDRIIKFETEYELRSDIVDQPGYVRDRQLKNPKLIKSLVEAGLMTPDPASTLIRYIEKTVKRAELERVFGGMATNKYADMSYEERERYKAMSRQEIEDMQNEYAEDWAQFQILRDKDNAQLSKDERRLVARVRQRGKLPFFGSARWEADAVLEQMIVDEVPESNQDEARSLTHSIVLNAPLDRTTKLYQFLSEVKAFESFRTMMMSGVASIPEAAAVFTRAKGELTVTEFSKRMWRIVSDKGYRGDMEDAARVLGVMRDDMGAAMASELTANEATDIQKGFFGKHLPKLFTFNGNNLVVKFTRVLATSIGTDFVNAQAGKLYKADQLARARGARAGIMGTDGRVRRDLGLSDDAWFELQSAADWLAELGIHDFNHVIVWAQANSRSDSSSPITVRWDSKAEDSPENDSIKIVNDALVSFANEAVLTPKASERPGWLDTLWGQMAGHLKSFMFAYLSVVVGGITRETSRKWERGEEISDQFLAWQFAMPFLLASAAVFAMMGALSEELRQRITTFGERGGWDKANGDPGTYLSNIADRAGFLSLPFFDALLHTDKGLGAITYQAGPAAHHVYELQDWLLRDEPQFERALWKSTPFISQLPTVRRGLYDDEGALDYAATGS